jgi:hypothetical protein
VENHEVPRTVGSRRSCEGVSSQVRREVRLPSHIGNLEDGEVRVLCLVKSRITISRINGSHRSSEEHVASDPGDRDIGVRGFQQQRKFASRIRDPRNPEVTW